MSEVLSSLIKEKARQIGFELVGITSAKPHPHLDFYNQWLAKGYHGSMEWLVRHADKKSDPQKILPGVQSLIVCGLSYNKPYPRSHEYLTPPDEESGSKVELSLTAQSALGGRSQIASSENGGPLHRAAGSYINSWISNYAWGDDYHEVVLEKLKQLEAFVLTQAPKAQLKSYVDTGAILERSYGQSAGLGWIGKNTLLINQKQGSFFFIGEILTTLELIPDTPDSDHCGTCTRCLDACPTQALTPYELDANKCISYLTIEHKGEISQELSAKMGQHLVGCDICQDVCPWNRKAPYSPLPEFEPREGLRAPKLDWAASLSPDEFTAQFKKSPIKRLKFEKWQRNVKRVRG